MLGYEPGEINGVLDGVTEDGPRTCACMSFVRRKNENAIPKCASNCLNSANADTPADEL